MRTNTMVKYFAEKISPAVHDVAARRQAFGGWKEELVHEWYGRREEFLQNEAQAKLEEAERREEETKRREEEAKRRETEAEDRIHQEYVQREQLIGHVNAMNMKKSEEERKAEMNQLKRDMKLSLAEKVSAATLQRALQTDGFGVWRESFKHERILLLIKCSRLKTIWKD
jgi:hypothetical protein